MKIHVLKCWPEFYHEVAEGRKTAELRYDDRYFKRGDWMVLREWSTDTGYSGWELRCEITHILAKHEGLVPGYVMLSFQVLEQYSRENPNAGQ